MSGAVGAARVVGGVKAVPAGGVVNTPAQPAQRVSLARSALLVLRYGTGSVRRVVAVFSTPSEMLDAVGRDLGRSDWISVDQQRIDLFADATGDHQWIHTDLAAAATGPFGATIAHGYLTLSLTNLFLPQIVRVEGISMGINYGVNKVRFPQPVLVGSRLRGSAVLTSAEELAGGAGVQAVITLTVEIEGQQKPACVVESVSRFLY